LVSLPLDAHAALSARIIFLFQMQGPDTNLSEEHWRKETRKIGGT
jgi:hypothetical protein